MTDLEVAENLFRIEDANKELRLKSQNEKQIKQLNIMDADIKKQLCSLYVN